MSKIAQDIILRPIITEESMLGTADKKYTFSVAKDANKIEIAKAVEELFKVEVKSVNGGLQDHRVLRRHDVIINQ